MQRNQWRIQKSKCGDEELEEVGRVFDAIDCTKKGYGIQKLGLGARLYPQSIAMGFRLDGVAASVANIWISVRSSLFDTCDRGVDHLAFL
ncbi:hypothetical protein Tco_0066488 [Tanacetum coccineum]